MLGDGTRRYVQLRADFTSTQTAGSQLDYVQFAVSIPPVASPPALARSSRSPYRRGR